MKNTVIRTSNQKIPALTPELSKFIQNMGMYFESQGISRIGGRILGLLMVAHEPLSAEEIASLLKVSRASISTNFSTLLITGLADKSTLHGDRTTYYTFPEASWNHLLNNAIQRNLMFKKIAEQGITALPEQDTARQRLEGAIEWANFLIESYQTMMSEWHKRHGSL